MTVKNGQIETLHFLPLLCHEFIEIATVSCEFIKSCLYVSIGHVDVAMKK
jgi:hypothetical protein